MDPLRISGNLYTSMSSVFLEESLIGWKSVAHGARLVWNRDRILNFCFLRLVQLLRERISLLRWSME